MESLGKRLKKVMIDHDLNQTKFGIRLGVTQTTVSNLLSGKLYPSYKMMQKLIKEFNLPIDFFTPIKVSNDQPDEIVKEPEIEYGKKQLIDFTLLEEKIRDLERRIYELEVSSN